MLWLLEQEARQAFEAAQKAGLTPTAEQQEKYEARYFGASDGTTPRILTIAGSSAEIEISGLLTKAPSFLAMLFGGGNTTYSEIVTAIAAAEQDENVQDITLAIDSPGGQFDGLFTAIDAIAAANKPMKAVVSNVAASAAYALASAADTITAANRAARFGSIGVVASFLVFEEEVEIASTAAPKKRPDVTTEEGKAIVREQLDEMHSLFVGAIATGRDTTPEKVNETFGQGATLLADESLKRGMIDGIAQTQPKAVPKPTPAANATSGKDTEAHDMTLEQLRTEHPAVYEAAVQIGMTQERDRVTAHLTMGEASGDMKTASKAIADGDAMTATHQATYMTAGMNKTDVGNRTAEEIATAEAADLAAKEKSKGEESDGVVAALAKKRGVDLGAEV